jgi:HPt (histidine-containing phosphotransfer) domain-containing protein
MQDCIAKPLRPGELLGILQRVAAAADGSNTETSHQPGRVPGRVLDEAALINLVAGDRKLLREFIDLFLEQSPQLVADIGAAVLCGDRAVLEQQAHALRGAAATATGERVAAIAYQLEAAARAGNWADAEQHCATLRGEFARLRDVLVCARVGTLP